METLDLHGISHRDAARLVENFILLKDLPLCIITGNSPEMKTIVIRVIEQYKFGWQYESYWNLGAIIVIDSN